MTQLSFRANTVEQARFDKFQDEHEAKCAPSKSATGEKYHIILMPTSIGTVWTVKCLICDKTENITDFDCW